MLRILTGLILSLMLPGLVSPSWANPTALNFIATIKGDVKLKRSQWKSYQKANWLYLLNPSDQLQLGAGASATVMCDNLKVWAVPAGKVSRVSDGCGSQAPIVTRSNSRRSPSRAPNETIPYIISPRNTVLLTNRPILRWKAVPGATRYQVRVQDAGLTLNWQAETSNTQIEYPGQPSLQLGSNYSLIVETDNQKSSEEEQGIDLSFTLLDTQKAESVRTEVAKLKQQKLTPEAESLALAYLYQSYDLKAEAIELLEGLGKRGSQTTAVYQILGDLYLQVGLSQQAKSSYLKALKLAQRTENVEGQVEAQMGLGEADYGLNNKDEAIAAWKKAKESYIVLGDRSQVQELEKRIAEILQ
jgi:predicted negative regulator of RcsB-dependent stress response